MAAPKGNKYAIGNSGGRPPLYDDPQVLSRAIDEYFIWIQGEIKVTKQKIKNPETGKTETIEKKEWVRHAEYATVTGLTLYLGFSHRGTLDDYEKKKEFADIIKRGRTRVEFEYEKKLHGDKNVGAIFALKNMGWKDKQETGFTDKDGNDITPFPAINVYNTAPPMAGSEDEITG